MTLVASMSHTLSCEVRYSAEQHSGCVPKQTLHQESRVKGVGDTCGDRWGCESRLRNTHKRTSFFPMLSAWFCTCMKLGLKLKFEAYSSAAAQRKWWLTTKSKEAAKRP